MHVYPASWTSSREDLPSTWRLSCGNQIPHESGAFPKQTLAHLNSPELLFSFQVLIQVLFGNQFKGHKILLIDGLALN
jgi:hypothetical protein